jgi:hypothetical protein
VAEDDHDHDHDELGHEHDHDDHGDHHDHGGDPAGEDMRALLAQQLLQLRPRDLLAQTAVMLANQAAIRLGMASPEHSDREQAREAIDALAGVVELLAPLSPAEEVEALRRDLAQLRMAYVQSAPPAAPAEETPEGDGPERPPIWTPGGDV